MSAEVLAFAGIVLAAAIAGVSSIVGAVITAKTRRENAEQHAASVDALHAVEGKVDDVVQKVDAVDGKLDEHIGWHHGREGQPA